MTRLLFGIIAVALCAAQSLAFNAGYTNAIHARHRSSSSPTFLIPRSTQQRSILFMAAAAAEGGDEVKEEATEKVTTAVAEDDAIITSEKKSRGALSIIPLVLKFCVVLAVKFVTDVLVFPPLFLWRLMRLIYRRFMALIGQGPKKNAAS